MKKKTRGNGLTRWQNGRTAPIIEVCNKKGVILIGITENLDSPLAKSSQIVIPMKIERESDPLNVMATSSFVATIAILTRCWRQSWR